MKIVFNKKYKSITEFNEVNIENFSVFLGVNGAGKTHLLKSMQEGSVSVGNIQCENVLYFNLQTFLIQNQHKITHRTLDDKKTASWSIFVSIKKQLQAVDNQIRTIVGNCDFPYDVDVEEEKKQRYISLLKDLQNRITEQCINKPINKQLINSAISESGKYISDLTEADFMTYANYDPDRYELLGSLSEVFLEYHKKITLAKLSRAMGGTELSEKEMINLQEMAPWTFVNNMFRSFGIKHTVNYPPFNAGELIKSQAMPFQVKLSIDEEEEIDFDDLSSGEKILCALAITIYQDNKSKFPELLLLDEIDASLHPSMIQHLLNVIDDVFIKKNCKVILATHSPTTIALAPSESLFEIKKGVTNEKIQRITQGNAINLLSEGIMTFEEGLKIYKSIDSSKYLHVLTEGNNAQHIEKAIGVLAKDLLTYVDIIHGEVGCTQLKNAFDALANANSLYTGKFLFVWDCDFFSTVEKIKDTASCIKFCFAANNENTRSIDKNGNATGIENLYSDDLFSDDLFIEKECNAAYGKTYQIIDLNKKLFLGKIEQLSDRNVFKNFIPLIDEINKILDV